MADASADQEPAAPAADAQLSAFAARKRKCAQFVEPDGWSHWRESGWLDLGYDPRQDTGEERFLYFCNLPASLRDVDVAIRNDSDILKRLVPNVFSKSVRIHCFLQNHWVCSVL